MISKNAMILLGFLLFQPGVSQAVPECEEYLSCRSAVLRRHLYCVERVRRLSAAVCKDEHEFRQYQVLSMRHEAQFSICVARENVLGKKSVPTNAAGCPSLRRFPNDTQWGCEVALAESLGACDTLRACCPQAEVCSRESAASWLTREVRKTSGNLLRYTEDCSNDMRKLIKGAVFGKEDVSVAENIVKADAKLRLLFYQQNEVRRSPQRFYGQTGAPFHSILPRWHAWGQQIPVSPVPIPPSPPWLHQLLSTRPQFTTVSPPVHAISNVITSHNPPSRPRPLPPPPPPTARPISELQPTDLERRTVTAPRRILSVGTIGEEPQRVIPRAHKLHRKAKARSDHTDLKTAEKILEMFEGPKKEIAPDDLSALLMEEKRESEAALKETIPLFVKIYTTKTPTTTMAPTTTPPTTQKTFAPLVFEGVRKDGRFENFAPWRSARWRMVEEETAGTVPRLAMHRQNVSRTVGTYFQPYFEKLKALKKGQLGPARFHSFPKRKIEPKAPGSELIEMEVTRESLEPFSFGNQALPIPDFDSRPSPTRSMPTIQSSDGSDEREISVPEAVPLPRFGSTAQVARSASPLRVLPKINGPYPSKISYRNRQQLAVVEPDIRNGFFEVVDSTGRRRQFSAGKTPKSQGRNPAFMVEEEIKSVKRVAIGPQKHFGRAGGKLEKRKARKRRKRINRKSQFLERTTQKPEETGGPEIVADDKKLIIKTRIRQSGVKVEEDMEMPETVTPKMMAKTEIVEPKLQGVPSIESGIDFTPLLNNIPDDTEQRRKILSDPAKYPAISSCELYAACVDEMNVQEEKCQPDVGRLLPGLPGRRLGDCNKEIIPKYQKLDAMGRQLEGVFIECLMGEIALQSQLGRTPLPAATCASPPSLPPLAKNCQKNVATAKRICEKYAECCPSVHSCRAKADDSLEAAAYKDEKSRLFDEAAQCQINAAREFRLKKYKKVEKIYGGLA